MVSHFPLLLLPTGSPLMKFRQVWPLRHSPDHTKRNLTEKSSPQPSILIFRKSQKKLATFPINFFRGIAKVWEGGCFSPPPAPDRVKCIYFWALPGLKPSLAMPIYICITDTHFEQVGWRYWLVLYRERFWDVGSFSWLQSSLQQAPHKVFHHLWLILPLANNQSSWTHRSGLLWHSLCNQTLRPRHIHHGCRQSITFSLL